MNPELVFVLVRVGNGPNFEKSKYPFWRTNRKWKTNFINILKTLTEGQSLILCFISSKLKKKDGKVLGFALYVSHHDMMDHPMKETHKITSEDQGWEWNDDSGFHLDYKNLCRIEKDHCNLSVCIQGPNCIIRYETNKHRACMSGDLHEYYQSFQEPISEPALIFPIIHSEEDPLEEEQRKLEEEEASLQRKKHDLEKRKREKEFRKWISSEDAFQCYLKAYSEDCTEIQKSDTLCHIRDPTKEMWKDLPDDKKRLLYSHYLISIDSQ